MIKKLGTHTTNKRIYLLPQQKTNIPLKNPNVFALMTIVEILVVADRKMYLADLTQNIKN